MKNINRRKFIQTTALASASLGLATTTSAAPNIITGKDDRILKLAVIGTGMRGRGMLKLMLNRKDCKVVALCDVDKDALAKAEALVIKAGQTKPKTFTGSDHAYEKLLQFDEVDAVYIATPWLWHVPISIAAMKAGKYTAKEVSGAMDIQQCWDLVNTHEETGSHFMFMENVNYRRDVMAILNMVRKGMFGELTHLEGGYQHDLRTVKFNDGIHPYGGGVEFGDKGYSEAKWRTNHSVYRDGDLYPTHGVGPVNKYININQGNRYLYLTSTSSKAINLHEYIVNNEKGGPNHPNAKVKFKLGDIVTTVLKTFNGETVVLSHDTNSPRPYSLGFRVQGTKGIWMAVNQSLYLEGLSQKKHHWELAEPYLKKYDHRLWKMHEQKAVGAGHGGMDFFVMNAFIESAKRNIAPPIDVYDAATMMAITVLSEQSIAAGSAPMPFPDFTRGQWMKRKANFAMEGDF